MNKKIICTVLAIAIIFTTMGTVVFADESYPTENWIDYANTDWYTGDKTTYVISSAEELAGLARLVNNGEAFTTVEFNDIIVKLGSNIDLDGKQWTPIGNLGGDKSGDTGHYSFSGVFDGDNKIVSNLCIYSKNTTEKKYANFGLFGSIGSYSESRKTTLKNLTVNNATVVCLDDQSQLGSSVAAVAGNANANITIDNVHVIGDIYIKGWSFVGGIVGHGYPTMKNCSVKATGTIITNQWCNGCLIGYLGEGPDVSDCVVEGQGEKGITLQSAMAGVGGAIGRTNGGNKIERVHVSGVNIQTSTWYAENYGVGYVASGVDTPEDSCSAENVIIKGDNDETLTPDDGDSIDVIVAYVGDVYYKTLQEAIEAAAPSGTVEIVADVTVDTWKMFWPGSSNDQCIGVEINGLTINGNGHSLTVNSIVSKGNGNQLFKNVENLNISNLTINIVEGAGGIGLKSGTIENVTFNGGTYAIYPGGDNLTINNCTFNNLNGTAIYYEKAYENLIVTNNTFNSPEKNAIILRGDEIFTGNNIIASRGVTVANSSSATISNNTFADDVRIKVYNESTAEITDNTLTKIEFESEEEPVNATFAGNILSDAAREALARVGLVSVAKIGNAEYCSLADAIAAAEDGAAITLYADAEITAEDYANITEKELTLTLGDYTLTAEDELADTSFITVPSGYKVKSTSTDGVYVYSIAKKTTSKQPSGNSGSYYPSYDYDSDKYVPEAEDKKDLSDFPFTDVTSNFWGYDGIAYCWQNNIMNGMTSTTFEPETSLSRAMLVTMLYRLAGSPEVETTENEWYSAARVWAMNNTISDGTNMNDEITREQLATMLCRYAAKQGVDTGISADLTVFTDAESISDYAYTSVSWAVRSGLMNGMGDETLSPNSGATRAQVATIFMRAADIIEK